MVCSLRCAWPVCERRGSGQRGEMSPGQAEHPMLRLLCKERELACREITSALAKRLMLTSTAMGERGILQYPDAFHPRGVSLKCFLDYFHSAEKGMSNRFSMKHPFQLGEQHLLLQLRCWELELFKCINFCWLQKQHHSTASF